MICFNDLASNRIIVLFLLDIIQVALVACMVGALLVGDLTDFNVASKSAGIPIDLKLIDCAFLFALAFAWHFVIVIWYSIRGGALRTRGMHLGYSGVYALMFIATVFMDQGEAASWYQVVEWILTLIFGGLICSLFWIKGKTDVTPVSMWHTYISRDFAGVANAVIACPYRLSLRFAHNKEGVHGSLDWYRTRVGVPVALYRPWDGFTPAYH